MSAREVEAIWFRFHSTLLLFREDSIDEILGGIYRVESMGPSHAEVGPYYGPYWSG